MKTLGPAPEGRYGHAAAMVGSKFFVFGGQTDEQSNNGGQQPAVVGGFKNDLCWFDLQKRAFPITLTLSLSVQGTDSGEGTSTVKLGQPRWSFVEYAPGAVVPPPRTGHTCVTHGDCLYMYVVRKILSFSKTTTESFGIVQLWRNRWTIPLQRHLVLRLELWNLD